MPLQIAVALYHRDQLSRGQTRKALGYEAYHWGMITMPEDGTKKDFHAFEATDACEIDQETFRMNNPNMDWWFRVRSPPDPAISDKMLGCIVISTAPADTTVEELEKTFKEVPLPAKNQNPQQSCVTWVVSAVEEVQRRKWVPEFDIPQFQSWALNYADERMEEQSVRGEIVRHEGSG